MLGDDEQRNAYELGRLAFGGPRLSADQPLPERAGRILWGAFAGDRLVAVVGDRVQGQWFGGRVVPASGISSVSVAAGERGKGYAQLLVARVLAAARERGAAVSTLFPTAPALYRRMGWEETGVLTWWDLPTSALAGLRPPPGTTTRPCNGRGQGNYPRPVRRGSRTDATVISRGTRPASPAGRSPASFPSTVSPWRSPPTGR